MRRARRLLLLAFALSLLVHLIVAIVLRPASPTQQGQPEVVSLERRHAMIAMTRQPTPPPRPKHTPAPNPVASAPPSTRKGPGTHGQVSGAGVAAATPAPAPSPAPTVKGACPQPNAGASVVSTPDPPDIAPDVRAAATNGTALVKVALDAEGQVSGASVAQSTGNSSLDLVAVAMARDARYAPAYAACKGVASTYDFSVKFVAW